MGWLKRLKAWHVALGVVALCGFGGWLTSWILTRNANAEVARATRRLRAIGIPTTPQDMVRNVPEADNAAPLYQQAMNIVRALNIKEPPFTKPRSTVIDYEVMASYVKSLDPVMGIVERASAKPDCYFNRNWSQGDQLLLPEFAELKRFAKAAAYTARLASRKGDWKTALHWDEVAFRIAKHADEPMLIGMLVRIAAESIALAELDKEIVDSGHKPEFRQAANALLNRIAPLPQTTLALRYETASLYITFEHMARPDYGQHTDDGMDIPSQLRFFVRLTPVRQAALGKVLNLYADTLERMHPDPADWNLGIKALGKIDHQIGSDQSVTGYIASAVTPVFGQAAYAVGRLQCQRDIARVALMLYDLKAKQGRFPEQLPASFPNDPLGKGPFVYRTAGDRFVLYGVGVNGKDDGGKPVGTSAYSDDIEFQVERPK